MCWRDGDQIILDTPEAAVYLMGCGVEAKVAEAAAVALPGESCAVLSDFAASKLPIEGYKTQLETSVLKRYEGSG